MSRQPGLGRGLNALIPAVDGAVGDDVLQHVALGRLVPNPNQPRGAFDERSLSELALSLQQVGMLQPILARPLDDGRLQIVAGERRYRAAGIASLTEVPVLIRRTSDDRVLTEALVENLHRTDLNPLEEAAAYRQLLDDLGMTHEQLAERLGRSRSSISNALRLLALPAVLQHKLAVGSLSAGHARTLLPLEDPEQQQRIAQRVIGEGMSVRATEELVRTLLDGPGPEASTASTRRPAPQVAGEAVQRLAGALSTSVRITGSERRGRVVIDFAGREDLERVLGIIGRGAGVDVVSSDA